MKEEALDRTMWRVRFGRVFGPVIRQTTNWTVSVEQETVFLTATYSSGRSSGYCSRRFVRAIKELTSAALKLIAGLSVGCGNDMSAISVSNEVKLTSMQRLHKVDDRYQLMQQFIYYYK